ncbi:hypothetical protein PLESTB_000784600 [Pleodorina starrii]|uniref:Uncharacterized protein n=1 Tax=Pleodorina starrii TaxID=330485 RepID=A0A9W6BKH7_9CHLO|nr:hypothetical protein PLESTM_000500300 [Pleodorina starrii]GLC53764.1 hypothetical protein PLESTB_000784600 [Pleodorina starrii]GLC72944.1 hypothetical protein PLESTF_001312200 [Pleodorina starrii]
MLTTKTNPLRCASRPPRVLSSSSWHLASMSCGRSRAAVHLRASNSSDTQTSAELPPPAVAAAPAQPAPLVYRSIASMSSMTSLSSLSSLASLDEYEEVSNFRFLPSQLEVFHELAKSMRFCSSGMSALAVGSVLMNAVEAVEHTHHQLQHAGHAAAEMAAAGAAAAEGAAAAAGQAAVAVAEHTAAAASGGTFFQELLRAVSLTDVAFCVNEIIPALLIMYAAVPFERLSKNPDVPHMGLALQGVGRLSLTLQQLAWTSGSVAVVLLLTAAAEYPAIVGVASWSVLALAMARGASLWWVISQHTTSGEEVARTLAALRGGSNARELNPLDRAASWLALGVLLQAEERMHADQHRLHAHMDHMHKLQGNEQGHGHHSPQAHGHANGNGAAADGASAAAAAVSLAPPPPKPHYAFDLEEERVLLSLVEGANAAGTAISLLVLATLALGLAEAAGESSSGWVSSVILASQKAANATALFAAAAAFDRALHNDDGNDDTDHLLDGLGREHGGMAGLFSSMAVLSLALILAGGVALLVPSLEESPLGVLLGDGVMHASADLLIEVLEAI